MSYPLDLDVDGSGMPLNAIHVRQEGIDEWQIQISRNGQIEVLGTLAIPFDGFGGASRVTRTPVRIVFSTTSLTLSYPTVPGASTTVSFAPLSWNQGVVQFGHHSYTPLKDCEDNPQFICAANTWHWDNIGISPALPFYQWQATPERTGAPITDSDPRPMSFGRRAPSGSALYFSGNCGVEVRDTESSEWREATIIQNIHSEHTQSYRVSVPTGSAGVEFRFVDNGPYAVSSGCQLSNPIIRALGAPAVPAGLGS
jgi:hypothetical protein